MGVEEYNHLIESLSEISILEGEIAKEIDQINFLESKISTQKSIKDSENTKLSAMIEHNNSKGKAKERNDDNQQRLDVLTTECNVLQDKYNSLTPVDDWRPDKVKQMGEDNYNSFLLFIFITGGYFALLDDALSNELLSGVISYIALFVFLGFAAGLGKNKNEIVQKIIN